MATNLVHQVGRATARELLESSFAQFQADKAVVTLAREVRKLEEGLEGYAESARCHLGDFMEYSRLRRRLGDLEAAAARSRKADSRDQILESLMALRPGDVIRVPTGKYAGFALVIDPGTRSDRSDPRPQVLTVDKHARRLSMVDFNHPVESLARMKVPRSFNHRSPQSRRELAIALSTRVHTLDPDAPSQRGRGGRGNSRGPTGAPEEAEITRARAAIRSHPCHGCDDRESHARWAERYHKLKRDIDTKRRRIESRTNTIARQFDRVCDVLTSLGYLVDDEVSPTGQRLMRIYTDMDLVAAECLRTGLWEGLDAAELAAALSTLVFENRRPDDASSPRLPAGRVRDVISDMVTLWGRLDRLERDHRLEFLREPDLGFAWAAHSWASGATLDEVLNETDLAAGDFVRWMKQVLDLTGQIADAAGPGPLRATAREAIALLRHGVVAYSSLAE
jgi:ATP-dependent RNA helicase HelY